MNAAGIDPKTIVTWDDYYNAGLEVLKKTGKPMCAVEVRDLFLPQMMLLEKDVQYVDASGKPQIDTPEHVEVINFIKKMLDAGICVVAPGGGFHTEEWYGFFDKGGVASLCMPLWYMGRFTDYMPDLKGKMGIYEIPVWKKGDTRCVLQGGTGTSITTQSKKPALAKEFLAYAKLSDTGNRYIWNVLGFDPIRTSLWTDKSVTNDPNNKFLKFFKTNPFDILNDVGADLTAPDISGAYAATYSVLVSTTYENVFEAQKDKDTGKVLKDEQASVIYDI
jgi:arabinosaccharide transport system substrate-binding protein